jgi:hypothetical protein
MSIAASQLDLTTPQAQLSSPAREETSSDDLYAGLFDCEASTRSESDIHRIGETMLDAESIRGKLASFAELLLTNELRELRNELEERVYQLEDSNEGLSVRDKRIKELEEEKAILLRNISTLYRTAVSEIQRKNDEIKALRRELIDARDARSSNQEGVGKDPRRDRERSPHRPLRSRDENRQWQKKH